MPRAFIPSPSRAQWHIGLLPVRASALFLVAAILLAFWLANRRYLRMGGRPGLVLGAATWAVPLGLAGARLYSVLIDHEVYFGGSRDWLGVLRIWDGGFGFPGALAGGMLGVVLACRRAGVSLGPLLGAAAPGLAFGQAVGRLGNWSDQELYGRPSGLPWAVEIAPAHRIPGYENYATFQPVFGYSALWDLAVGLGVIWAVRRFLLAGDRAFALYVAGAAAGGYLAQSLRIDVVPGLLGMWADQWVLAGLSLAGVAYVLRTKSRGGPDPGASSRILERARIPVPAGLARRDQGR